MKTLSFKTATIIVGVIALIGLGVGGFYYTKYQSAQKELQTVINDPKTAQKAAATEVQRLVDKVGKLIELPKETPTVATITDISKLKGQAFFTNAKNGDKVLIYTGAKKAILYNEAGNKIIDVAPVNIGNSSATQSQAKIAILNGTSVAGAASKVETQITTAFPGVSIVSKTDAKGNYDKSVVVALNSAASAAAANVAKAIGATVSNLPAGESKPAGTDLIVIIGKDLVK